MTHPKKTILLKDVFSQNPPMFHLGGKLAQFVVLNLQLIQSLEEEKMTADGAVLFFYNADNCLYVKRIFKGNADAQDLMARGIQLPDLFTVLPVAKARKEFRKELKIMRAASRRLLLNHSLLGSHGQRTERKVPTPMPRRLAATA